MDLTISLAFFTPSTLEQTYRRSFFLYLTFQFAMMPASRGWVFDVVFLGRNLILMFEKLSAMLGGWQGALSSNSRKLRFFLFNFSFNLASHIFHDFGIHPSLRVGIIPAPIWAFNILQIIEATQFCIFSDDNRVLLFTRSINKKGPRMPLFDLLSSPTSPSLFVQACIR